MEEGIQKIKSGVKRDDPEINSSAFSEDLATVNENTENAIKHIKILKDITGKVSFDETIFENLKKP